MLLKNPYVGGRASDVSGEIILKPTAFVSQRQKGIFYFSLGNFRGILHNVYIEEDPITYPYRLASDNEIQYFSLVESAQGHYMV